jgi:hypothetical protein
MDHPYENPKAEPRFTTLCAMETPLITESEYVRRVLAAYCHTRTTTGRANRQDHLTAVGFYRRGIPLDVVENAFILGAIRRLQRDPNAPPLSPVRSLRYFDGLIDEVSQIKSDPQTKSAYPRYFQYLRFTLAHFDELRDRFLQALQS